MTDRPRQLQREGGFTLVEILIVLIIVSLLLIAAIVASRAAQVSSRNDSMATAGSTIDAAIGAFNRMYPPVPDPVTNAVRDELVQRSQNQVWSGNAGNPSAGLSDETGEWLVPDWPANPYDQGGVQVRRFNGPASCNSGQPGEVRVCRTPADGAMTYRITAWGRDRDDNPQLVYEAEHGTS